MSEPWATMDMEEESKREAAAIYKCLQSEIEELAASVGKGAKLCSWCGVIHKIGENTLCPITNRIKELEATIQRLRDVRNDLATQTLNSHAVKMLDKALEQDDD